MTRTSVIDDSSFWTTVEDSIDDDFTDVLPEVGDDGTNDWYQDAPEVSLPRECMPHWRTRH